jgi:hypothetical protein
MAVRPRRYVSIRDSFTVHAAPATAGYPGDGSVIPPVRVLCGAILRGELVDTSGRSLSCPYCARELYPGRKLADLALNGVYDGPIR